MGATTWLGESNRMVRILDELPDPLVALDAVAKVLWANTSAEAFLGYGRGELVGRNGLDLIDPRDVETAAAALLRTLDSGGLKEPWPLRVVGRDGGSRWAEMAPSNLLGDPEIGAVLISVRSLDGRHAVEAEARAIEELFRRAFDDAPIGMALVAVDGRLTRVNNALCGVLQRPMLELLGVHARTLTHPDDIEVERPLAEALLAGERGERSRPGPPGDP